MPKIFSKDTKITVVEYGSTSQPTMSWQDFKSKVQEFVPVILKKAS